MKKHYSLLLAFLVAFSSLFVSCDENEWFEELNKCRITVVATDGGEVKISKYLQTSELILLGSEIDIVATPNDGYVFTGWYVNDSTEPISGDAIFTFVATKNTTLTAHFSIPVGEAIDLGLPSGLKWATMNVGATSPEDYGGYYAWGETEEKDNYDWSTYKWCNGSSYTMTKYCTDSSYGTVDNKTVLDPEDDVAYVKWGGSWRMPTLDEQDELRNNCTWTWTTQNGVNGYNVTGPNGNSIFLPAAGSSYGTEKYDIELCGGYWSSSLYSDNSYSALSLNFYNGRYDKGYVNRCHGRIVRPVSE